jgi:RNA polymerase sigma-70 factor, ECF subfamily
VSDDEVFWVLRAQCGDRAALEQLLRSVQGSLQRYVRGVVGIEDAEDITQDVLVQIYRKLRWLRAPHVFRPWAFRIASRAAFRHLRRRRRFVVDDVDPESIGGTVEPPPDFALDELLGADTVSPASRAVLLLHFREDLTLPEVAAVLEIPLGTVKSRLAYGLRGLRRHIDAHRKLEGV